jgi:uncharacterized protein YcbX
MAVEARIAFINRYPVKGFSAESMESVALLRGRPFPGDRIYAIENGDSGYDPANPAFQPKLKYLELMRNPRLSALDTAYDHVTRVMTIAQGGKVLAGGDLGTEAGRAAIEQFLSGFMSDDLRGPVKVLTGTLGYQFMDSPSSGAISLLGLASLRALAGLAGRRQLEPGRMRMNFGLEGLPPWGEFDLVGKTVRLGGARVQIVKPTERCAAINVAPGRGVRDVRLLPMMEERLGHHNCGVYAKVIDSGEVRVGDALVLEQEAMI